MTKDKKEKPVVDQENNIVDSLTEDLQRTRADFENYRKRVEIEKTQAKEAGQMSAILKLLPVIDTISRSISYVPDEIKDNNWVKGIIGLEKNLEKSLEALNLTKIEAAPDMVFDPELHNAISMDEDAEGETEVISEVLQPGYLLSGKTLRHAMVKVTRK